MQSAVELGESLKASKRLEKFKQNAADEIHREEDQRESYCYHCDQDGETSRQNLAKLVRATGQQSRSELPLEFRSPFGFGFSFAKPKVTEFRLSVQYCSLSGLLASWPDIDSYPCKHRNWSVRRSVISDAPFMVGAICDEGWFWDHV